MTLGAASAWNGFMYHAAKHKAEIINKKYGTKYTQDQVFYGGDVIEEILKTQRKRIEVNGNLLRKGSGL
jgi:hypothetical protein